MTGETNAEMIFDELARPIIGESGKYPGIMLWRAILVCALLAVASPSIAEEAHHSDSTTLATPPAAASPVPGGQPGMTSGGMTGSGMMSSAMMNVDLMSMMGPMAQMMSPKHIEGRIAFLQTELKITDAQQPMWSAFVEVLRANAHVMADMMTQMQGSMMPSQITAEDALLQRIARHEQMLAAQLEGLRKMKAVLQPLYAVLDDTQKQTANELLAPGPMGLM